MRITTPTDPDEIDLDAVDLADPRTYSEGDPHAIWQAMRLRDPVRWQSVDGDLGFWSVTKYEDGSEVLRDHTTFTSQRGTLLNLLGKDDPAGGRQMAATDPPRHTRMRGPLQRALTIKSVERSRDQIAAKVRGLLEPGLSGETFDIAAAVIQLPMTVTGMLMGLPEEDWPRLTRLTLMSIAPDDPEFMVEQGPTATLEQAHRELFAYFADIVKQRQKVQGDDLISLLVSMDFDGRTLSLGEVLSNCYSLLLGANVTTPYVPTAALNWLIGTDSMHELFHDPAVVVTGVEEALRWASPANHFMRYALHDVELGGKKIRSGDAVVVWLGSANRDADIFEDPFTFNLRRKPNRHIAFGAGAHYCVGHTVARVSLRVLFGEILDTFIDFERDGEAEHLCSNFVAGIKHMPVIAKARPR